MTYGDTEYMLSAAREASRTLTSLSDESRNQILYELADAIEEAIPTIMAANAADLERMDRSDPKYDRLRLTADRLHAIASDTRNVATLPSPLVELERRTLPNGLTVTKQAVPFGVIGVIYEARPNVTVDVFSLCFKAGNACVLKGGHDAAESNKAMVKVIHRVLSHSDIDADVCTLLPPTREATATLLNARGKVDLLIPRGSRSLIDYVRAEAHIPVIETGAGVCHTYIDSSADIEMAADIVTNAKTRRVSVCNALDCVIVNSEMLDKLGEICHRLAEKSVRIHADIRAYQALDGQYPAELLSMATADDFGTEYLDYAMSIRTVDTIDEAIDHIDRYGSGHSEAIVTGNSHHADQFTRCVDAACVYVNAPTSFTDGAQFGLGAEIGISTQKLHARGPMALREITTYKWVITGNGQIRP